MRPVTPREIIHAPAGWLCDPALGRITSTALWALAGFACYGLTLGWWRAPLMGSYTMVKLPLLVALTLGANALLNGILGMLLGTGLGLRQSFLALLTSFTVAGLILGSLSPVTFLLAWNAPPPGTAGESVSHASFLVFHTFLLGFAGVVANVRLYRLLTAQTTSRTAARATLFCWLGGNAFLGAQFSYVLRPFFGTPGLPVQFLRDDPLRGNFYEALWGSLDRLCGGNAAFFLPFAVLSAGIIALPILHISNHKRKRP